VSLAALSTECDRDVSWLSRAERGERRLDHAVADDLAGAVQRIAKRQYQADAERLVDRARQLFAVKPAGAAQ
jgi:hypothetical protein